jgi:hypothetical protein
MIDNSKTLVASALLVAAPLAFVLTSPVAASADGGFTLSGSVSSATITGGDSAVETITLSAPAPTSGVGINLRGRALNGEAIYGDSSNGYFDTVRVPAGATTIRVPFHVTAPRTELVLPLEGQLSGSVQWVELAKLTVLPADPAVRSVRSLALSTGSTTEGTTVTGTVTLNQPAPVDGITVNVGVDYEALGAGPDVPALTTPWFVTVPNGSTTATFPIRVTSVPNATIVPIIASLGTTSGTPDLVVVHSNRLTLANGGSTPGADFKMAVGIGTTWNGFGATVALQSDNQNVTVPATVKIPGWTPGVAFPVSVNTQAPHNTSVKITATWLGNTVTSTVYIR